MSLGHENFQETIVPIESILPNISMINSRLYSESSTVALVGSTESSCSFFGPASASPPKIESQPQNSMTKNIRSLTSMIAWRR